MLTKNLQHSRKKELMPNEAVVTKPIPFPVFKTESLEPKRTWLIRFGIWIGTLMAHPESPKGWVINPSVITLALVILGLVAGGSYYMGQRDAESKMLLQRIQQAEVDAAEAKKLAVYQAGVADVHGKEKK